MGSSLSLIHLPAQSGKTRKMTELINRWNLITDLSGNSSDCLNVIFTSNTKLLTKQTAGRITTDVDDVSQISDLSSDEEDSLSIEMDIGEKVSKTLAWISSGKKLSVADVFTNVMLGAVGNGINNIICCTNKIRMKNVQKLLEDLNRMFMAGCFKKRVNIWIDEADACIKLWENYIEWFLRITNNSDFVQNIVLVSATMVPVYNRLHKRGIEPNLRTYENTYAPVYHKYSESIVRHEYSENAKYPIVQLKAVLENNPELMSAGSRVFCPGNKARRSHEELCNELLNTGFNVLLLNGVYKELRFCDGSPAIHLSEQLETDLEISKTLNGLYYELELFNSPFAVTGNLCIGRGITFASQIEGREFLFTHGIIPEVSNGDEGYQMVARCCGNIKGFASYQAPTIFVSEKTDLLIRQQENIAIQFAKSFYQDGVESVKVTRNMLKEATGDEEDECDKEERKREKAETLRFIMGDTVDFATLEEANNYCKQIKPGSQKEKEESFKNEATNEYVISTTRKGKKKFTYEEFMTESSTWNATSLLNMKDLNAGKVSKVIKPVYKGDAVVWLVRWAVHVIKGNVKRPDDVSNEELAIAIHTRNCRIEVVNNTQLEVIMNNNA
jgi:hypothetical protein